MRKKLAKYTLGLRKIREEFMARIKPSYYYERQAEEAKKREVYYRTPRPPKPTNTAVKQRENDKIFYRSLNQKIGTDSIVYGIFVTRAALALVTPAQAGLLLVEPTTAGVVVLNRPRGFFPSVAKWYKGVATPSYVQTKYQTSYPRYSEKNTTGQSSFSMPISVETGEVTAAKVEAAYKAIFNPGGTANVTLLGAKNGRASLTLEKSGGNSVVT
jgi:hypothetical protein